MKPTTVYVRKPADANRIQRLLAHAAEKPAAVWARVSAVPAPGVAPVDEILLMEAGPGEGMSVFWARHRGSFTGTTMHLEGTGSDNNRELIQQWSQLVYELAELVGKSSNVACDLQAAYLRWQADYGPTMISRADTCDEISNWLSDHTADELGDLGNLTIAVIKSIAAGDNSSACPPGWELDGPDAPASETPPVDQAPRRWIRRIRQRRRAGGGRDR